MRVVQLLPELNEGGVEQGVVELSRELVRFGIESFVISAGGKMVDRIIADGGQHVTLDVASKNLLTVPWRIHQLGKALDAIGADIIHARSRVPAWLALLANRRRRVPFVTTVHGFNSVSPYSRVMTLGDRVICVSKAIKEYIQAHYGVSEDKIVVIPEGIDLNLFDPEQLDREFMAEFSRRYCLEGRYVATTVGRITQLKDYETFIRAVGLLKKDMPQVVGLIVGGVRDDKKAYFESLKRLVHELNLQHHIVFTGSQSKVAEIYALSDVVVSSSKKPESFGRTVAEALAMNVPVVATAHGGVLDMVKEGETGFLFPPEQPEFLAEAVRKCRVVQWHHFRDFIAEAFTLKRMVENTVRIYRDASRLE